MDTNKDKQIIEINGIKLEVDTRHARRIDSFRLGDKVKVLVPDYEKKRTVCPGVIVGFEDFQSLPTIVIAYLTCDYGNSKLKFLSFNSELDGYDIVLSDDDYLPIEKDYVIDRMDREIATKEAELDTLKAKKKYFLDHFNRYFEVKD